MIPRCTCGILEREAEGEGWRWAHAASCPSYTDPLPPTDDEMLLANAGWFRRDGGWVYPDLDLGDAIPFEEALRIERGWQENDAAVLARREGGS